MDGTRSSSGFERGEENIVSVEFSKPMEIDEEYSGSLVPCSDCNLWFANKSSLRKHQDAVHNMKSTDVTDNAASCVKSMTDVKEEDDSLKILRIMNEQADESSGNMGASSVDVLSKQENPSCIQDSVRCHDSVGGASANILSTQRDSLSIQDIVTPSPSTNGVVVTNDPDISPVYGGSHGTDGSKETDTNDSSQSCDHKAKHLDSPSLQKPHKPHRRGSSIKCSHCPGREKTFSSPRALHVHRQQHHKKEIDHKCHNCGHRFKQTHAVAASSARSVYTQTGIDSWMCELCCADNFTSYLAIQEHKSTVHRFISKTGEPQEQRSSSVCRFCSKSFQFPNQLRKHEMVHTGEKPNHCPHCPKRFRLKSQLEAHVNLHTKQTLYVCGECDARFYRSAELARHLRFKHQEWQYQCRFCLKAHATKQGLTEHEKTHLGVKSYICEECGVGFARKQNLNHHLKAHRNDRSYRCEICQKAFFRKSTLKEHQRTHTGEKPYGCQRCDKCFTQKCHLRAHLRSHLRQELEKTQPVTTSGSSIEVVTTDGKTAAVVTSPSDQTNDARIDDTAITTERSIHELAASSTICDEQESVISTDAGSHHGLQTRTPVQANMLASDERDIDTPQDLAEIKTHNSGTERQVVTNDDMVIVCEDAPVVPEIGGQTTVTDDEPVILQPFSVVMPVKEQS